MLRKISRLGDQDGDVSKSEKSSCQRFQHMVFFPVLNVKKKKKKRKEAQI